MNYRPAMTLSVIAWVVMVAVIVLFTFLMVIAYLAGCSVTVESGSALRHHGETSEDHAEPTPTPTPVTS